MKLKVLVLLFLLTTAFSIVLPDFEADVISVSDNVKPGTPAEFMLELVNSEDEVLQAQPFISGPRPAWIQPYDYYIEVPANSKVTVPIEIAPGEDADAGSYEYTVTTKVKVNDEWYNVLPEKFTLFVARETPEVVIPETEMEIYTDNGEYTPDSKIKTTVRITRLEETYKEMNVDLTFMDTERNPIYSSLISVASRVEPIVVMHEFELDKKIPPGDYILVTDLKTEKGTIAQASQVVSITRNDEIEIKKSLEIGLLQKTLTMKAINKGNVASSGSIVETIRWYERWLVTSNPQPDIVEDKGQSIDLKWTFTNLGPGAETREITFKISYLPVVLLLIVAVLLLIVGWQGSKTVVVRKQVDSQKFNKEDTLDAKITITIRNLTEKSLRNVVLQDSLPPLVKITKSELTKPSEIKSNKKGTRMEWDLGDLRPLEERVVHYHVKSKFGIVGIVDLPFSELRYTDLQGKRKTARSNTTEMGKVE